MTQTSVLAVHRKSPALHRAAFGCLRQAWVANVTRGCMLGCVYCYARGYANAPPPGTVLLYKNLPDQLARELDSPRRRSPVSWVAFNTASDSFQPHPRIQEVTQRAMRVLLERGIRVSILTKGWIPRSLMPLLASYAGQVHIRVGLISLDDQIQETFEPHAAPSEERLCAIRLLREAGVPVSVRVDPILPFLTDTEASIGPLLDALATEGLRQVTISYLHLRPQIAVQMEQELPSTLHRLILGCFQGRPWGEVGAKSFTRLLPKVLRVRGYELFRRMADERGIEVCVCRCKNPDLPGESCLGEMVSEDQMGRVATKRGTPRQLRLFDQAPDHKSSCST